MTGNDHLRIGDFARLAGTGLRTLRYYEELGLLVPIERTAGGFRHYRRTDVNRVRLIQSLQDMGLSLDEIGDLVRLRDSGAPREVWLGQVQATLTRVDNLVDERIRELEEQKRGIAAARHKLTECAECSFCPVEENNHCEPCEATGRALPALLSALF